MVSGGKVFPVISCPGPNRSLPGAALSQGQVRICVASAVLSPSQVQMSWQTQRFRKVGAHFVAGAALSQSQLQISWQARFRKAGYGFPRTRGTFKCRSLSRNMFAHVEAQLVSHKF